MVLFPFPPSLPFSIRLFRFNSLLVLMMIKIKISVNAFALTGRWGGGREGGKMGLASQSWGLLWWPNATEGGREGGRRNEQARLGLCALPSSS